MNILLCCFFVVYRQVYIFVSLLLSFVSQIHFGCSWQWFSAINKIKNDAICYLPCTKEKISY